MSRHIIKQPNGKYCIFSSVVDNVLYYDMTKEEIVEEWVKEYREIIEREVQLLINKLEDNNPLQRFTMSYFYLY